MSVLNFRTSSPLPSFDFWSHSLTTMYTDEKAVVGEKTWQVNLMQLGPEEMLDIAKGSIVRDFEVMCPSHQE